MKDGEVYSFIQMAPQLPATCVHVCACIGGMNVCASVPCAYTHVCVCVNAWMCTPVYKERV